MVICAPRVRQCRTAEVRGTVFGSPVGQLRFDFTKSRTYNERGPEEVFFCFGRVFMANRLVRAGTAKSVALRNGPPIQERAGRYFREVRGELTRVEWPSRAELIAMTIVVIIVLLAMALYLGAWDAVFTWLFQTVLVKR